MMKKITLLFVAACLTMSGAAFAGPLDNATEFQEKAVEEAEERSNPPAMQSDESSPISWADDTSNQAAPVNTGAINTTPDDR